MHDPMLMLTGVVAVVTHTLGRRPSSRRDRSRCGLDRAGAVVRRRRDQRGSGRGDHLEPDPRHGEHPGAVAVGPLTRSDEPSGSHRRTSDADPAPSRLRGDRGAATSLAVALLTPMFVFLAFAAFQAALWSHARTEARVVARDTAALVARSGVAAGDAQSSATAILEADTDLRNVVVSVGSTGGVVTVTVSADAPGITPRHHQCRLGHVGGADRGDHAVNRRPAHAIPVRPTRSGWRCWRRRRSGWPW